MTNKISCITSVFRGKHNLKKHNIVLVCGKGAKDLPNVYTHAIRNKLDLNKSTFKRR